MAKVGCEASFLSLEAANPAQVTLYGQLILDKELKRSQYPIAEVRRAEENGRGPWRWWGFEGEDRNVFKCHDDVRMFEEAYCHGRYRCPSSAYI